MPGWTSLMWMWETHSSSRRRKAAPAPPAKGSAYRVGTGSWIARSWAKKGARRTFPPGYRRGDRFLMRLMLLDLPFRGHWTRRLRQRLFHGHEHWSEELVEVVDFVACSGLEDIVDEGV
ncbi:Uncharacterised protein [Chlamydia trachomatis]|nr:Uncharacterised protein [Chlamydia trachomatis]